jgi:hypothetical protein
MADDLTALRALAVLPVNNRRNTGSEAQHSSSRWIAGGVLVRVCDASIDSAAAPRERNLRFLSLGTHSSLSGPVLRADNRGDRRNMAGFHPTLCT